MTVQDQHSDDREPPGEVGRHGHHGEDPVEPTNDGEQHRDDHRGQAHGPDDGEDQGEGDEHPESDPRLHREDDAKGRRDALTPATPQERTEHVAKDDTHTGEERRIPPERPLGGEDRQPAFEDVEDEDTDAPAGTEHATGVRCARVPRTAGAQVLAEKSGKGRRGVERSDDESHHAHTQQGQRQEGQPTPGELGTHGFRLA